MTEERKDVGKAITPIFVLLLIVASFLGGSFFNQYKAEEKSGTESEAAGAEVEASPQVEAEGEEEPETNVLGVEDQGLIEDSETVKGNADAPVTIVEFSEYECPYCKRYIDETYVKIWEEYEGEIRYIFRDYPLPFHQHSQITAEAAHCAGDQGEYWAYHDLLFANRDGWAQSEEPTSLLSGYAADLGLNEEEFSGCLSSGKYTQAVKDDFKLGQQVGVSGTPSFFINGRLLVGAQPFEAFQAIIEEELEK